MRAIRHIDTRGISERDFVSTIPIEAASASTEIGADPHPHRPHTVGLLQIIKRKLRALAIKRLRP